MKKVKWPTLEGRKKHALTDTKTALLQLKQSGLTLTKYAEGVLKNEMIKSSNKKS